MIKRLLLIIRNWFTYDDFDINEYNDRRIDRD